jgi:hypothetical protein
LNLQDKAIKDLQSVSMANFLLIETVTTDSRNHKLKKQNEWNQKLEKIKKDYIQY